MPKVKKSQKPKKSTKNPSVRDQFKAIWMRFSRALMAASVLLAVGVFFLLLSGGYIGLAGAKLSSAMHAGTAAIGFDVRRITVLGLDKVSERDLKSAVGPIIGTSILSVDPYAARARVEALGWVRSAAVTRLLPGTVHISVRERTPAAIWQMSGALHLIDPDGAVIREVGAYEYANLPLIVGAGAPETASEILSALRAEPALWGRVSALIRVSNRRWNMRTLADYDIRFPEKDFVEAVHFLARVHEKTGILDEPLDYIDLRNTENLVYRQKSREEATLADAGEPQ